jgi:hypothetical protein
MGANLIDAGGLGHDNQRPPTEMAAAPSREPTSYTQLLVADFSF